MPREGAGNGWSKTMEGKYPTGRVRRNNSMTTETIGKNMWNGKWIPTISKTLEEFVHVWRTGDARRGTLPLRLFSHSSRSEENVT